MSFQRSPGKDEHAGISGYFKENCKLFAWSFVRLDFTQRWSKRILSWTRQLMWWVGPKTAGVDVGTSSSPTLSAEGLGQPCVWEIFHAVITPLFCHGQRYFRCKCLTIPWRRKSLSRRHVGVSVGGLCSRSCICVLPREQHLRSELQQGRDNLHPQSPKFAKY